MFSRQSSSHNLLFHKAVSRAVSYSQFEGLDEHLEESRESSSTSFQIKRSGSSSVPLIAKSVEKKETGRLTATSRQKLILVILCLANFSATVFYSCIAPFFPSYAALKGATETEVGLIFGCFQLVIFLLSPLWGIWSSKIGPKFLFVAGIMTTGFAAILMGFLQFCPPGSAFVMMCFIIRIVDAAGVSAFMTASFTIIANEFPHSISTVFGACETFNGLGYTLGPPIGGLLYQVGGFMVPFHVLGSLVCLCGLTAWFLFPTFEIPAPKEHPSYKKYLSIPGVWVSLLAVFSATLGLGFLDAMYGPHLEEFGIGPAYVGIVFLLPSVLYFICAPLVGIEVDRKGFAYELMIGGAFMSAVCYLFMGPAPFLKLSGKAGFPDDFDTHGLVSGAISSATALGAFIGPAIGGVIVEEFGFSWAVTGISFFQVLVGLATLVIAAAGWKPRRKNVIFIGGQDCPSPPPDERTPLI